MWPPGVTYPLGYRDPFATAAEKTRLWETETDMVRVAVVTGGTRGIGQAISVALKHKGCRVAANYGGNDAAARQFQVETGIPVYKFDVSNFGNCQEGVARITRDLGPIDILV